MKCPRCKKVHFGITTLCGKCYMEEISDICICKNSKHDDFWLCMKCNEKVSNHTYHCLKCGKILHIETFEFREVFMTYGLCNNCREPWEFEH